jgi:hypothetical protein
VSRVRPILTTRHLCLLLAEDEDVLVDDQVHRHAGRAGGADVLELEEGRPGYQLSVADPGEEGDAALDGDEACGLAGGDDGCGQVDELAVVAPGAGGDGDVRAVSLALSRSGLSGR